MNLEQIQTEKAPKAVGPYSQAIKIGGFIYTSGQIPLNPKTGEIVNGGIEAEARQVLENLSAVLESAGVTLDHVIKTTIFLKNLEDFAKVNEIYASYFTTQLPARSCVEVARLPKDVSIEIEAIGYCK